ncbi:MULTISPECIES: GDYXXLXY domain-containing protein [unclassified Bradyrhizobium]|uniref:GDYXXLXY domain-containing protein n=1 Tax=unclassified Bradyrhizobium TaxID=2631580 RepID=UPI001FF38724|nr:MULTISPECIES: GDYXXLXY domain-containing protein [unclassified Bradyrhizobium]MCJ9705646.1 GDYXXLXY domain-containing protein [Bradyrhizobium sp. SHOUNA76]MCJ9734044.1 GDYXXLXY domain-containing protein [Bradyrhizobium sp. PRIMUS42]
MIGAITRFWQRIPKAVLFGVAVLVQCLLLVLMVADRMQILREGREVTLQTQPVDPRDLLRGDYVVLRYDISQLPAGALAGKPADARNPVVFVKLAPNADGLYAAVSVHAAPVPVTAPEVLIRGRVSYSCGSDVRTFCDKLTIKYGLESYFVPEGEGGKLEQARNQQKLRIVAAVLPSGRAAIKRLLLDGEPVYEEPLY